MKFRSKLGSNSKLWDLSPILKILDSIVEFIKPWALQDSYGLQAFVMWFSQDSYQLVWEPSIMSLGCKRTTWVVMLTLQCSLQTSQKGYCTTRGSLTTTKTDGINQHLSSLYEKYAIYFFSKYLFVLSPNLFHSRVSVFSYLSNTL